MIQRRVLFLLPALVFLALALWFWRGLQPNRDPTLIPSVMIDKPVPEFNLPPLHGNGPGLKSANLKGRLTLINFFASWCVPCRAEHPILLDLAQDHRVELDGIAYKNKPEDASSFLGELGNPFAKVALDQAGRTAIDFGVYGVPESYLVDKQGRIRFRQVGPITQDIVEGQLKPLIAELAK
jgi:cytochrome c biogenesis protein CcmG, thiol:disulfide interchange protein DsbE